MNGSKGQHACNLVLTKNSSKRPPSLSLVWTPCAGTPIDDCKSSEVKFEIWMTDDGGCNIALRVVLIGGVSVVIEASLSIDVITMGDTR